MCYSKFTNGNGIIFQKNYHQEREELVKQIAELQEESKRCHSREEDYVKYIRSLEQKNDDLERSQRYVDYIPLF